MQLCNIGKGRSSAPVPNASPYGRFDGIGVERDSGGNGYDGEKTDEHEKCLQISLGTGI